MNNPMSKKSQLTNELKQYAYNCGIDLIGIATPEPFARYLNELDARKSMYQERYGQRLEQWIKMAKPDELLPTAKSLIVMGFYYLTDDCLDQSNPGDPCGVIGRVILHGHLGIIKGMRKIINFLKERNFNVIGGLHRKEAVLRSGLGFIGKNTLTINKKFGSYVAYQCLVTDAELEYDLTSTTENCGECEKCLNSCPTKALYAPYKLDPRKCLTYLLTHSNIPIDILDKAGKRILGCDLCQEVCLKNKDLLPKTNLECAFPPPINISPSLISILEMEEDYFQAEIIKVMLAKFSIGEATESDEMVPETFIFAGNKRKLYQRNALLALAYARDEKTIPAIVKVLEGSDYFLRFYAARALSKMKYNKQARMALQEALKKESDETFRKQLQEFI